MKRVLIIVDMQRDFIDGALANDLGQTIVKNVVREIKSDYYNYFALTRDSHGEDYLNSLEGRNLPIKHCVRSSFGWELNSDVLKALRDNGYQYKIFDKNGFGLFEINDELSKIQDQIESITLLGLCTDICVVTMSLIIRAKFPNIPMFVVEDACGGTSEDAHKAGMKVMESCQIYRK